MLGAFLEVEMPKKCTPLWREAHFLKTKLFCKLSSIFELDNVENEAIPRDLLNFPS